MILPDLNLLLYAYNPESRFRSEAAAWWLDVMNGAEPVGLAVPVAMGFVRLSTQTYAFRKPLPTSAATLIVREWLAVPHVQLLRIEVADLDRALRLLDRCGTAGNLVSDALLASLAIAHNAVIHTADTDFARFQPVKWINPLVR